MLKPSFSNYKKNLLKTLAKEPSFRAVAAFARSAWPGKARGKSGGYRVIYYLITTDSILLTHLYAKSDRGNLTAAQLKILKSIFK